MARFYKNNKERDCLFLSGILRWFSLLHLANGISDSSILSSQMTMNSTPVLMTTPASSMTSSLISRDIYTNSLIYISPSPTQRQYITPVQNIRFTNNTSFFIAIPFTLESSMLHQSPESAFYSSHYSRSYLSVKVISYSTTLHLSTRSASCSLSPVTKNSMAMSSLSSVRTDSLKYFHSSLLYSQRVPVPSSPFMLKTVSSVTPTSEKFFNTLSYASAFPQNRTKPTSVTTVSSTNSIVPHSASIYLVKPSMVIKPPPLQFQTTSSLKALLRGCNSNSCCTYGLSQLPAQLVFKESETRGYVMAAIRNVQDLHLTVKITGPFEIASILSDNFVITQTTNGYSLILSKEIDLEDLYDKTDGKVDVHNIQMQISCTENSSIIVPPRLLNVTISDVDDNMPVFSQHGIDSKDCVVPVYKANTSEDYTGELSLSPGKIEAVDGDVSCQHNISYRVMHSEPANYHVYFSLDTYNGTVHKIKTMNSSDPKKYVIFVQAVEDSPQQKSRVAVLLVVVVAPSNPYSKQHKVNPTARFVLQIVCAFILMAFICGIVVVVHHRYTLSRAKVESVQGSELRDMKLPKLAVYQSSNSSLNSTMPENPDIKSPSQIVVASYENTLQPTKWDSENRRGSTDRRESESQKKRRLIVKKPVDTKSRPNWNAPPPKPKRTRYNPFSVYQTQHNIH